MAYQPPSVTVTSIANNRIINLAEDARIPAIVGPGPSSLVVTDFPIARGSGEFDLLPVSGSVAPTLTKIAAFPGAGASNSSWSGYYSTSGSYSVYWDGVSGTSEPLEGEVYYASFTYPIPTTQHDVKLFTDSKDIQATYGTEGSADSDITLAASLALENGAPAVFCVQVSGNPAAQANWATAFTKLEKKNNVAYVVPLMSGSSASSLSPIQTAAISHVNNESAPLKGHEREVILGAHADTTVANFKSLAIGVADRRVVLVAPATSITRTSPNGTSLTLQGYHIAAALSGLITAQDKVISPVTGKVVTGFVIPDDQYTPFEMNLMGGNGVCVLNAASGVIKVRHAVTTDPTSADTREISVVSADDLVRRITRTSLTDAYIGKGIVINEGTPAGVEATVAAIWSGLVREGLISAFGTKFDPQTGEVPISAEQDTAEPTKINITGSVSFLYPLNYIDVSFFIYV